MRLIDADALKEKAWDAKTQCGYVQVIDVGDIDDAPTIEPETEEEAYERGYTAGQMAGLKKTGRWIDRQLIYSDLHVATCSNCKMRVAVGKFCPNCGSDNREDIPMEYFESGGT